MKFQQFYSGSTANLYTVTAANGKRLLIECGVRWTDLQKALNYDLSGIQACFVSHSHKDHSKAIHDVLHAGIDVYATSETFKSLDALNGYRRTNIVADKTLVRLKDFDVLCFKTNHDCEGSLGFVVREKTNIMKHTPGRKYDEPMDEYLLFATDTSHITQRFKLGFNIIAIECSYDIHILQDRVDRKDINETLAKRLLTSHMEKQAAMKYLAEYCDLSHCRELHLLHMSSDNIDKESARKDFEQRFYIQTIAKGTESKECQNTKS